MKGSNILTYMTSIVAKETTCLLKECELI